MRAWPDACETAFNFPRFSPPFRFFSSFYPPSTPRFISRASNARVTTVVARKFEKKEREGKRDVRLSINLRGSILAESVNREASLGRERERDREMDGWMDREREGEGGWRAILVRGAHNSGPSIVPGLHPRRRLVVATGVPDAFWPYTPPFLRLLLSFPPTFARRRRLFSPASADLSFNSSGGLN